MSPGNGDHRSGMPDPSTLNVIDLKIVNDVEAELGLDEMPGAMTTLCYLADSGGEVGWNWNGGIDPKTGLWKPLSHETRERVTDLINMGLCVEREYVSSAAQAEGTGRLTLVLTDKGKNVVETHRKRRVVMSEARPLHAEEIAELARAHAKNQGNKDD